MNISSIKSFFTDLSFAFKACSVVVKRNRKTTPHISEELSQDDWDLGVSALTGNIQLVDGYDVYGNPC